MSGPVESEVTRILRQAEAGDPVAGERLLPLVYEELRSLAHQRMAGEAPGRSIQTTELVHEAWLRLVGDEGVRWESRAHFFGAAARAMRRILVDRARRRQSIKRGGDRARLDLGRIEIAADDQPPELILGLDEAIERLADRDQRKADIVALRFFAGLTIEQTARALGLAPTTVKDEWHFARAWLQSEIGRGGH